MLTRIFCLLLALMPLLPLSASAQQASWQLKNISNATLQFETFDPARGTWKQQTIYPNQTVNYTMSYGVTEGKFHINTKDRGFVEYRVLAGRSYTLGWDRNKGVWDLKFAQGSSAKMPGNAAPDSDYRPRQGSYQLYNASDADLTFETFEPARGTWKTQSVYSGETKTFTMSSATVVGKIRIATDGRGSVQYDVRNGWKYKLIWSHQKGVWDFRTVERGD